MNNTFNLHRFNLLLKRQWLEFGKVYLMTLGVVLVILLCFYILNLNNIESYIKSNTANYILRFREPLFTLLGLLFISIAATTYFTHLGNKAKAIGDILTPASVLEKYLTGIFYTTIVPILSYVLIFYVVDFIFIKANFSSYTYVDNVYIQGKYVEKTIEKNDWLFFNYNALSHSYFNYAASVCSVFSLVVTSIFLAGSIYFNRFQYIKTIVSVSVFIGVLTLVYIQTVNFFFDNKVLVNPNQSDHNSGEFSMYILVTAMMLIALFFYVLGYIRYKEKEV